MGKFYWLKLKNSFFKRHDIRFVESLPDGKEIVYFYLKLMVESVDHDGELRFSKEIPYSNQMLAVLTNTEPSFVENALVTLSQYGMIEILDDKTIAIPKVEEMIDSASDTDVAGRVRRYRERQKNADVTKCNDSVTESVTTPLQNVTHPVTKCNESKSKSKSIELEIDKEKDKRETTSRFSKPSLAEISEYCNERQNNINPEKFFSYYESNGWKVGRNPMKDWKACVRTWEQNDQKTGKSEETVNPFTELRRREGYI